VSPETRDGPMRGSVTSATNDKAKCLENQRPLMGSSATLSGMTTSSLFISACVPVTLETSFDTRSCKQHPFEQSKTVLYLFRFTCLESSLFVTPYNITAETKLL